MSLLGGEENAGRDREGEKPTWGVSSSQLTLWKLGLDPTGNLGEQGGTEPQVSLPEDEGAGVSIHQLLEAMGGRPKGSNSPLLLSCLSRLQRGPSGQVTGADPGFWPV